MSKYARKVDRNHAEIFNGLKACGIPCYDTSRYPGLLDVHALTMKGRLVYLEIKMPGEPLTPAEIKTFELFEGVCYRVETLEEALAICRDE